ncbi:MAG: fibronectin type III domain-containing protein [Bacteroidales bacterium]
MKSKIFVTLFSGALLTAVSGEMTPLKAANYINNLPLQVTSADHFFSISNNGSAEISLKALNQIYALKTTNWTQTGTATMVIAFKDVPGILKIKADAVGGATCTSGSHNDLSISESADNKTFDTPVALSANVTHDITIALKPTTRYIKFHFNVKANGIFSGSYCGHEFDPVTFALPKSVDILSENRIIKGLTGEILKDTISVEYSNPQGNLLFESSNPAFSYRKLTESDEANAEGKSDFEISYTATLPEDANTTIKVSDTGYPAAFEEINLTAQILASTAPDAPTTVTSGTASYSNVFVSWDAVQNISSYLILVYDKNDMPVTEYSTTGTEYTISDLTPNTEYKIGIKSVNEKGISSAISPLITVITKAIATPSRLVVNSTKNTVVANWDVVADAQKYLIKLLNKENIIEQEFELPVDQTSYTFMNATRGTDYTVSVQTMIDLFKSEAVTTTTTTSLDFGTQLKNNGFEKWEAVEKGSEPENWNSFGTVTGSMAGFAKAEQVQASSNIRPGSKGTQSAHIYSKMIGSIAANGNMTTGRIYANSWTAADLSNYNAIVVDDAKFHQVVEERPDSVSIWVKYVPANADSQVAEARLSFILHANGIVKDPSASVSDLVVSKAELNYAPCDWQRVTLPFETVKDIQPKFMLASITTNKAPGVGTGGVDNVFVDDLVLIYKPSLSTGNLTNVSYHEGDSFELPFTLTGSMSVSNIDAAANTVYAELSDHTGSFDNPTVICEPIVTDESGILKIQLPTKMISGSKYQIRVVTTNYPMTALSDQEFAIEGSDVPNSLETTQMKTCKLYPNPAKERIFITNADAATYRICNLSNQVITRNIYHAEYGIDVSGLATGIYFIEIQSDSVSQKIKFIKE